MVGTSTEFSRGRSLQTYPVEQPTKFELVVNLETETLGVEVPSSQLLRADQMVE